MTLDAFIGLWLFSMVLAYAILIALPGLFDLFPHERPGLRIDFKHD